MVTKTTDAGHAYEIVDGKRFVWHPLDDNDEAGNLPDVVIPLRMKLKVIRSIAGQDLDVAAMFTILESLIPGQAEALDEMDIVLDFQPMFTTWQSEYNALNGATPGGIAALADLIDAHRGAFEYDWRTRFHRPLRIIGRSMSWGEAIRLTNQLATLPDSHVAAAIAGWEHPVTREGIVLMDLFDLQHQSKSKRKPQPYPRPWPNKDSKRFGRSPYSPEKTRAILDAHRRGTRAAEPSVPVAQQRPARRRDARGRFVAAST